MPGRIFLLVFFTISVHKIPDLAVTESESRDGKAAGYRRVYFAVIICVESGVFQFELVLINLQK